MPTMNPVLFAQAMSQAKQYKKKEGKDYATGFIQGLSFLNTIDVKQKKDLIYAIF